MSSVKDELLIIKNHFCGTGSPAAGGVKQIVGSTAGELTAQQKIDVEAKLRGGSSEGGQDRIEIIIDPAQSPSFDPTNLGENFANYDATGQGTNDIASDMCDQACDAYDDECAENYTASAKKTRTLETTIVAFRLKAGIVE